MIKLTTEEWNSHTGCQYCKIGKSTGDPNPVDNCGLTIEQRNSCAKELNLSKELSHDK